MTIQYLTYREIDKAKWDQCIDHASNGLIYAYSFYLDAMALQWDALVMNDYEAVMPLTWNRKYGIHYLYQPPFIASLGVFGNNITAEIVNEFLKAIPSRFKYWDIYLNHGNLFKLADFNLDERMNYILPLNEPYEKIYGHYRENIQRNTKKAEQYGLRIRKDAGITEVTGLARQQSREFASIPAEAFRRFEELYHWLQQKGKATSYGVQTKDGRLVASAAFFFSHNRAYYIMVGNHADGKTLGASHSLINAFIRDHAGKDLLLDFEGSDIPSLAFFYSSFGAREERYSAIKLNRLPVLVKWMKRS